MISKELTKGTLQPIILKLLVDNDRMYGYEITQKVKELTAGKIDISEGALYPILHKLVHQELLETEKVFIGKRVRVYYKIKKSGKAAVIKKTDELFDFINTLSLIFSKPSPVK